MTSLHPPNPIIASISSTQHPQPARQLPFSYIGLSLHRTPHQKSWGLVFIKTQSSHAFIVSINRTLYDESMMLKWSRITSQIPHPSLVYSSVECYEQFLIQNFPTDVRSNDGNASDISSPSIQPGDAILSINGIAVSAFPTNQSLASFIRQHCSQTMAMVVMRHEVVWRAAKLAVQQQQQQLTNNWVATTVKNSWIAVNNNFKTNTNKTTFAYIQKPTTSPTPPKKKRKLTPNPHTTFDNRQLYNPMFKDPNGNPILYCDNDDYEPDDGKRIHLFLNDEIERDFNGWLKRRKETWRETWKESIRKSASIVDNEHDDEKSTVAHDFWLASGYDTFDQWLVASKMKWRRSYSWHINRIHQLEEECEKMVHLPYAPVLESVGDVEQFKDWLGVRKQQWRIERRKRQRRQQHQNAVGDNLPNPVSASTANGIVERSSNNATTVEATVSTVTTTNNDTMYIDEMLEKQEECDNNAAELAKQRPMDVSWIFNSQLGAPDDVLLVIMKFLQPFEHGNLLCLSYTSHTLFKQRETMWKSLCPKHWVLPRRPRKSWCVMYITKIRAEEEAFRKRSDDLLVKANVIIEKGDLLNKLEKLVKKAEKDFRFDVNYTSGVVLERNSLLNMAIIDKRTKIAKWLMEQKNADIESCDRGQFTPLLNAAYNGDKHMVRHLLVRGADRTKKGLNHSSKGLAPAGFEGLSAEEWARQRGHHNVAELIRIGI